MFILVVVSLIWWNFAFSCWTDPLRQAFQVALLGNRTIPYHEWRRRSPLSDHSNSQITSLLDNLMLWNSSPSLFPLFYFHNHAYRYVCKCNHPNQNLKFSSQNAFFFIFLQFFRGFLRCPFFSFWSTGDLLLFLLFLVVSGFCGVKRVLYTFVNFLNKWVPFAMVLLLRLFAELVWIGHRRMYSFYMFRGKTRDLSKERVIWSTLPIYGSGLCRILSESWISIILVHKW